MTTFSTQFTPRNLNFSARLEEIEPTMDEMTEVAIDFLNPDLFHILVIVVYYALQIPVLFFGVWTNLLNVIIFAQSGQRDSVTIALVFLSVSDFGYLTCYLLVRVFEAFEMYFNVHSKMKLGHRGLAHFLAFVSFFLQDSSTIITVFVAVQKCCCVAIPHLFKGFFTTRRAIVMMTILILITVGTNLPKMAGMRFKPTALQPLSNETLITLTMTPLYEKSIVYWYVFNRLIYPAVAQFISAICVIIMTIQLKKSAKFRSSINNDINAPDKDNSADDTKSGSSKLGYKERRAVTAVAIVSAVFVLSSIPWSILSIARLLAEDFFDDPRNQRFRRLLTNSQVILVHMSASINIFIYLKYNTKFKQTAEKLFARCLCCNGDSLKNKDMR